jgi:hypothetical protein
MAALVIVTLGVIALARSTFGDRCQDCLDWIPLRQVTDCPEQVMVLQRQLRQLDLLFYGSAGLFVAAVAMDRLVKPFKRLGQSK